MKVSDWLREYQLTGKIPERDVGLVAFWAGWLVGVSCGERRIAQSLSEALDMAIKAAEFIEAAR